MLFSVAFPILVQIVPFWVWSSHGRQERIVTATAAIQQAQKYQSMLRTHGKCVSGLPGWNAAPDEGPGVLITEVKVTGKQLKIECDRKERKFWVSISFPRDDFGHVEGPFVGPLKIAYWRGTNLETKVIQQNADTDVLAKLLAFGD